MVARSLRWQLLVVGVALVFVYDCGHRDAGVSREPTAEELVEVFSGVAPTELTPSPLPHYRGAFVSGSTRVEAAGVSTSALAPVVVGYVDEINALVVVDREGTIRSARVLAHRETPYYMELVLGSGFLDRFVGRNVVDGIGEIDGVTGASITAKAIRKDVSAAAALASVEVFGLPVEVPAGSSWTAAVKDPKLIAVVVALSLALFARLSKWPARGRREAAWVVSLLLIGVYAMTPYTLVHSFQLLRLDFPGPSNVILVALAGFVLVSTLALGPVWCAYACPFGALQELLAKLPFGRWEVSPRVMRYAREGRNLVLFVAVAGAFGLGEHAFAEVEPFGHLFARTQDRLVWIFIAVVLFTSLFVRRFWCRFFCPTGACLVMLSSHRRIFKRIQKGLHDAGIDRADVGEDG